MKRVMKFMALLCILMFLGLTQIVTLLPAKITIFEQSAIQTGTPLISASKDSYLLFGVMPVKSASLNVIENKTLNAVGQVVGIKLYTRGLHVIGLSNIPSENEMVVGPGKSAGLQLGDSITHFNDVQLGSSDEFVDLVRENHDKTATLTVVRNNKELRLTITPQFYEQTGEYKLGVWVRESTAGIGTVTYFDEETGRFGALGHGITDSNSGYMYDILRGECVECTLFDIVKGEAGAPGELKGLFNHNSKKIGDLTKNLSTGIYGTVTNADLINKESYPIRLKNQVKTGQATIMSNISGKDVETFEVEILRTNTILSPQNRDMVIKVTDEGLLSRTGGIVQGMSGSPIIQDEHIIGAVTHVFVNDPTMGYGIFIENMLE